MWFVEKMTSSHVVCVQLALILLIVATVPFTNARSVINAILCCIIKSSRRELYALVLSISVHLTDCLFGCLSVAFFTARRVCIARTMSWQNVCPSVRRTPVLCLNSYTCPQSFFTVE